HDRADREGASRARPSPRECDSHRGLLLVPTGPLAGVAALSSRGKAERVFIGRKPELELLRAGLERAIGGRGGTFLIAGEPGIGKSELADRVAAEAEAHGAEVIWGRAWEGEGAPPYWPWAQIFRSYAQ